MLQQNLRVIEIRSLILNELSERMDLAFVAINQQRQVETLSPAAELILSRRDGLRLIRNGLEAEKYTENRALQKILQSVLDTVAPETSRHTTAVGGSILISRRAPHLQLRLSVVPLQRDDLTPEQNPLALVLMSAPETPLASRAVVMRELFKLLPSEARLTDLLLQGFDVKQAAERMQITISSARFLLRGAFRKAGVGNQSSLIRLMLTLPGRRSEHNVS
jgi:DNA-binding CsgD family transcriptional regulator